MDESSMNKQALLNVPQYISSESLLCLFPRESLVFPNKFLQSILGRVSVPCWSTTRRSIRLDLSVWYLRVMLILLDIINFSSLTSLRDLLIPQRRLLSSKSSWTCGYSPKKVFCLFPNNLRQPIAVECSGFIQEQLNTILFYGVCINQEQLNALVSIKSSWTPIYFTLFCFNQEKLNATVSTKSCWIWHL